MQYPTNETRCLWWTLLMVSTSAWNSLSPWWLSIFNCLTATSCPPGRTPLCTYPKPPCPRRLASEKPLVATINWSYVKTTHEKPKAAPGRGDGISDTRLSKPERPLLLMWEGWGNGFGNTLRNCALDRRTFFCE